MINRVTNRLIHLMVSVTVLTQLAALSNAEEKQVRLHGYVGGPYKVLADDFTGNGSPDILLGYHALGVITTEVNMTSRKFAPPILRSFSGVHDKRVLEQNAWSPPIVHNMACADVDGDKLADLLLAVGGLNTIQKGRIILIRNMGVGMFEVKATYEVPSQAKGVAFADLDNDGTMDVLYTARGSGYDRDLAEGLLYMRRGLGDWKYSDPVISPAGKSAYYIETADLNDDGFVDIIVPNEHASHATYFINPGVSVFTTYVNRRPIASQRVTASQIPGERSHAVNDVRAADMNGDGVPDLITANLGTSTISVFIGNGDGTFKDDLLYRGGKNGAFLGIGDFDGDGDKDVAITHWTEEFISILLNQGDGVLGTPTHYRAGSGNYGIAVADLDADGHLDLVTADYRAKSSSVLYGVGNGTFHPAEIRKRGLRNHHGEIITAD